MFQTMNMFNYSIYFESKIIACQPKNVYWENHIKKQVYKCSFLDLFLIQMYYELQYMCTRFHRKIAVLSLNCTLWYFTFPNNLDPKQNNNWGIYVVIFVRTRNAVLSARVTCCHRLGQVEFYCVKHCYFTKKGENKQKPYKLYI